MLTSALIMLGGLALLVAGADWFVKGAAGLADAFGVAPIVVGLTVVAYGTSMPELVVSAVAALDGRSAIALGNVVGSNIANIGLILGVTALVSPPAVEGSIIRREVPALITAALAVPLVLLDGVISRLDGIVLLCGAAAFTWITVRFASSAGVTDPVLQGTIEEVRGQTPRGSRLRLSIFAAVGLAMLLSGGKLFVDAAAGIAATLGVSERVIGLTVVAVGTSLPELAASVTAALRGHSAMAVGNVIGSNIFNVVFVLGAASVVYPIEGALQSMQRDLLVMLAFTAVAALLLRGARRINRVEGALLLAAYVAAMGWLSA
jgi:cation:H+ antiporter